MTDRVSIRMYRVGFGDCFLLRFWSGDKAAKVLIDCGTITEGQAQVDRVARDVIEACRDADGVSRINLVVATHRHRDHVGGFAGSAWGEVEAGAVWMPWTEDPADPDATRIRNRQSALALALAPEVRDQEPLAPGAPPSASLAVDAMALNALTNEKAMATLHGGFAKRVAPAFLPLANAPFEVRTAPGIDDLKVHVLGPPRDEAMIAVMDPPAGKGYLAGPSGVAGSSQAFGSHWRLDAAAYLGACPGSTFSPDDMRLVEQRAEQPEGALAAALDNAVNNTSLILVFEVGDLCLLFPGDAQWGAWNAALTNPAARALLARTNFYKVGHHGSHNATPVEFIDQVVQPRFTAMFSTCHVPQWPDIPRAPLVAAIAGKAARYARSDDEAAAAAAGFAVQPGLYEEIELPTTAGRALGPIPASTVPEPAE